MTVPGVGPVTSVRFVSTLDRIDRFPSAHHVQAYLGLTPGESSSGERQLRTGITKAGAPAMRWTLRNAPGACDASDATTPCRSGPARWRSDVASASPSPP